MRRHQALVDGFSIKIDMEYAGKTFKKMLHSDHWPRTAIFHSMLKWLVENSRYVVEAGELVILIYLSTRTVVALYKDGLHGRALDVVQMLYNNGETGLVSL